MKKLCFGSFLAVLVKCKAHSTSQKKLCGTMLLSINPFDDRQTDDGFASALVRGKSNLPDMIKDNAPSVDASAVVKYFRDNVIPLLDNNLKPNIVLALKDIIEDDNDIRPDTEVEMVNHIEKSDMREFRCFVYEEFLAGIFLYTCIVPENRGNTDRIDEITDDYIRNFDAKSADITFKNDNSKLNEKVAMEIALDAHMMSLLTDSEGKCLKCGRPLVAHRDGQEVNYAHIVCLLGEDMLLCGDCENEMQSASDDDKATLVLQKKNLTSLSAARDSVTRHELGKEIEEVLRQVSDLEVDDNTRLKTAAIPVERKISEKGLRMDVLNDVRPLYEGVNDVLDRLGGESALNVTTFAKKIRRMFEDAEENGLSQNQIYELLVNTLYDKSGRKYRRACRIIISYFVQRCEVFNEITK